MYKNVHSSFIYNENIKSPKYSSSAEWIRGGIFRKHCNKGGNPTAVYNMDKSSRITVNKRNQPQKNKYCMPLLT